MVREYLLTYRHINGHLIRKHLTESDVDEVYESPFVAEVVAETEIDFDNYRKSITEHERKEREYVEKHGNLLAKPHKHIIEE